MYLPDLYWRRIIRLGRAWAKNGSSSDNPSVYKYKQADESSIHTSYRDSPSCETNCRGYLVKTDDPYACPYLYTDGLSNELPFFAQARPRRMIRFQYKSGHCLV